MRNYWMPDYREATGVNGILRTDILVQPKMEYDIRFLVYELPDGKVKAYWREMKDPESSRELLAYCQPKVGSYPATVKDAEKIPGAMEILERIFPQKEYEFGDYDKEKLQKLLKRKLPFRIRVRAAGEGCKYDTTVFRDKDTVRYTITDAFPSSWKPLMQIIDTLVWKANLDYPDYLPKQTSISDGKDYKLQVCGAVVSELSKRQNREKKQAKE